MNDFTNRLLCEDAVLVTVEATQGSAPRDAGAWMGVFADDIVGTIGGGHLEFQAIDQARQLLAGQGGAAVQSFALGPSLGQCCGGVVRLRFERVTRSGRAGTPGAARAVAGSGGVVRRRPRRHRRWSTRWRRCRSPSPGSTAATKSSRPICRPTCAASIPTRCRARCPVCAPLSRVLIMSFSHAQDLDVVAACLMRQRERGDLAYIGLIGSATKWATFRHRLEQRGFTESELAQVTCPIGIPGIAGKEPEVIAVSVAAQLLQLQQPAPP